MPNINPSEIRDATSRFAKRLERPETRQMIDDAASTVKDVYENTSHWVQENRGKSAAIVAGVAAVGVLGYLIGRRVLSSSPAIE